MQETRRQKMDELRRRLEDLLPTPEPFDLLQRAQRLEQARLLCHEAFDLYRRQPDRRAEEHLWRLTAALWHQAQDDFYTDEFEENFRNLQRRDPKALEPAVRFLEIDPWCFRSGYIKQDLIRHILRYQLNELYQARLAKVVLNAIDYRDRREFRYYCRLAKKVQSPQLKQEIEKRVSSQDAAVRRRALWVLARLTHGSKFHITRGILQFKRKQYKDAVGDLTRALLLGADWWTTTAYFWRGKSCAQLQEFEKAVADFSRVIDLDEQANASLCRVSQSYWQERKDVRGYLWRGHMHSRLHKYLEAVDDFSKAIDGQASNAYAWYGRARALHKLGDDQKALPDIDRSIELNPNDAEGYYVRGMVYLGLFDWDAAIKDLQRAIELDQPKQSVRYVKLSQAFFESRKYQDAFDAATEAVKLCNASADGHCWLAKACFELEMYDDAVAHFSSSIELAQGPDKAPYYRLRAKAYDKLGQSDLFEQDLQWLREHPIEVDDERGN